ncbi:hypothetical protein ACP4OV_002233 [Aristida adscensionis]
MDSVAAGDRLSSLGDGVLGHILSFLPAAEAARAAVLSRRWRHVFAAVHTLSFDEPPERPGIRGRCPYSDYWAPVGRALVPAAPPFLAVVTAALLARHRAARAPPLRALRVTLGLFRGGASAPLVDGWLSYAVHQAGDELHVDLRLSRDPICFGHYALRPRRGPDDLVALAPDEGAGYGEPDHDDAYDDDGEEEDPASAWPYYGVVDDGAYAVGYGGAGYLQVEGYSRPPREHEYVPPRSLFSCAALRSLRLGHCYLDPPAAATLPSLDTLHLTSTSGPGSGVHRLVAACPRLADLTLEDLAAVTTLSLLGRRLRRLALRCCHDTAAVAVDSSELRDFEYRGEVPAPTFLTFHGSPPQVRPSPRRHLHLRVPRLCGAAQPRAHRDAAGGRHRRRGHRGHRRRGHRDAA